MSATITTSLAQCSWTEGKEEHDTFGKDSFLFFLGKDSFQMIRTHKILTMKMFQLSGNFALC